MCYAPGILAYSLQKLFTISLYARMNTRTPAIITAVALVMNFAFSLYLMQSMLHGGLAAGSAIAAWCGVLIFHRGFAERAGFCAHPSRCSKTWCVLSP
jgi:putative peptidoglycan lipid II flippase